MSSKREIRKLSQFVREELRYMQRAIDNNDIEWIITHAQQAAGIAATLEESVFTYAKNCMPTRTSVISHVTPIG
jgi:hypothetical protein